MRSNQVKLEWLRREHAKAKDRLAIALQSACPALVQQYKVEVSKVSQSILALDFSGASR
jgi:hypothetical protein